jgi:hypothetical protein
MLGTKRPLAGPPHLLPLLAPNPTSVINLRLDRVRGDRAVGLSRSAAFDSWGLTAVECGLELGQGGQVAAGAPGGGGGDGDLFARREGDRRACDRGDSCFELGSCGAWTAVVVAATVSSAVPSSAAPTISAAVISCGVVAAAAEARQIRARRVFGEQRSRAGLFGDGREVRAGDGCVFGDEGGFGRARRSVATRGGDDGEGEEEGGGAGDPAFHGHGLLRGSLDQVEGLAPDPFLFFSP